jgi:hypothetical protein
MVKVTPSLIWVFPVILYGLFAFVQVLLLFINPETCVCATATAGIKQTKKRRDRRGFK